MTDHAVIGVDFGTDSVRALIVDALTGNTLGEASAAYPRWKQGLFCIPEKNQFRQHPLDYLEAMEGALKSAIADVKSPMRVRAMAVDTTGSTPVALDASGNPLALAPGFETDPDAMFILWKDHTAVAEAAAITKAAKTWGGEDFTRYSGGTYSSEWFWSKILRTLRVNPKIREAAASWAEHCDWMTAVLTGQTAQLKRSRCAAGHKAMWHKDFGGLPPKAFWEQVDPLLAPVCDQLFSRTLTADTPAGTLAPEWAEKLGLSTDVIIATGVIDAHAGAVGGEIRPGELLKVMGTSTCDMLTAPVEQVGNRLIKGICGQVDGSIIPGLVGMEAGQSAFGDLYAWFRDLLLWPVKEILDPGGDEFQKTADAILPALSRAAEAIEPGSSAPLALDWMNGRRTPDADQGLKGAITHLTLGSSAPAIFRSLVEATAFGSRAIAQRFQDEGIPINGVIAVGGVAKKSPLVMQIVADVMDMEIRVAASEQTCALGSAMLAAVAGGIHPHVDAAQTAMGKGFETTYTPNPERVALYDELYGRYLRLGSFMAGEK